jgi:putative Ig domain-containing protein
VAFSFDKPLLPATQTKFGFGHSDTRNVVFARSHRADETPVPIFFFLLLLLCFTALTTACGTPARANSHAATTVPGTTQVRMTITNSTLAEAVAGSPYTASLAAAGGTTPYEWSLAAGTLPSGIKMQSSGVVTGTTVLAGTYSFTAKVTDASGNTATRALTLAVSSILIIENSFLPEVDAATPYAASLAATGGITPYEWSLAAGTLPSGIKMQSSGVVTGTAVLAGTYPFTAKVTDASGNTATRALTLAVSSILAIADSSFPEVDAATPYAVPLAATGGIAPYEWSLAAGTLPSGIKMQSSGVISGTTVQSGTYSFIAKVTDASGSNATAAFTLTVSSLLTIANSTLPEVDAATPYINWLAANGGVTPYRWSLAAGALPSGIQMQSSGVISGTTVQSGTYSFTAQVTDASGKTATAAFTLTVSSSLAIANAALTEVDAGTPYSVSLSATGGIAPYQWSLATGALPSGIQLQSSGVITGTSALAGTYPFTAKVTDASGNNVTAVFTLTVSSLLTIASSTLPEVDAATPYSASLSAAGGITPYQWSLATGALPSGIQLQSSGVLTGTSALAGTYPFTAKVTDASGNNVTAAFTLTVSSLLTIANSTPAPVDAGTPYSASLSATGGITPYQWSLATGALPPGIQLLASSGAITGTTATPGSYSFTAKVTDASGNSATGAFSLTVSSNGGFDGPAELPLIYIQSAMANTPAPGSTITVNAGGDFQSALNSADCGDTIQLQAGATFTGSFTFPANSCNDSNWIIVRTSADDSALPTEGTRLTPCYAGIASLPGRPALNCASTTNVLAKLVMPASGSGPVAFAAGANHYRLVGLEITRTVGTGLVYALASVSNGGTANNIIFDRVWVHGTAQDDTNRGIDLGGTTYTSTVDSFLTDFHCVSLTGACTDSQAISGGVGNAPMGPYKILGNFLEAAGENILFGGGSATGPATDIQVSQNHLFKPLTWMQGQAGYVGGSNGNPFVVKNLFELKNAQRVLLDGNLMEDTWGGFTQFGFGILLTPKSQAGSGDSNLCPDCVVTDVTIRYSTISHVAAGLQIANALSDNGGAALDGERYSIHDIVVDDIDGVKYNGTGLFAQVSVGPGAPLLQNVRINHVTAFPPSMLFLVGDNVATSGAMNNFVFTNSIVNAAQFPVWSTGGGAANCAYYDVPLTTFNACFTGSAFATNAIIAASSAYPAAKWPTGNFFPLSTGAVQFVNYNNGIGGNYQLMSTSPYHNAGSDGMDLGADIGMIQSETATAY